jgi:hypothetical protein
MNVKIRYSFITRLQGLSAARLRDVRRAAVEGTRHAPYAAGLRGSGGAWDSDESSFFAIAACVRREAPGEHFQDGPRASNASLKSLSLGTDQMSSQGPPPLGGHLGPYLDGQGPWARPIEMYGFPETPHPGESLNPRPDTQALQ